MTWQWGELSQALVGISWKQQRTSSKHKFKSMARWFPHSGQLMVTILSTACCGHSIFNVSKENPNWTNSLRNNIVKMMIYKDTHLWLGENTCDCIFLCSSSGFPYHVISQNVLFRFVFLDLVQSGTDRLTQCSDSA